MEEGERIYENVGRIGEEGIRMDEIEELGVQIEGEGTGEVGGGIGGEVIDEEGGREEGIEDGGEGERSKGEGGEGDGGEGEGGGRGLRGWRGFRSPMSFFRSRVRRRMEEEGESSEGESSGSTALMSLSVAGPMMPLAHSTPSHGHVSAPPPSRASSSSSDYATLREYAAPTVFSPPPKPPRAFTPHPEGERREYLLRGGTKVCVSKEKKEKKKKK